MSDENHSEEPLALLTPFLLTVGGALLVVIIYLSMHLG